jgi:DNA polymerase III subunit epsilon
MRKALILDTETTGFSHSTDQIVEVAFILYDLKYAAPISAFSSLLYGKSNAAEHVNAIDPELLEEAMSFKFIGHVFTELIDMCDVLVAHNAQFDRGFLEADKLLGIGKVDKPWVCTQRQIQWPKQSDKKTLYSIALAHGVPLISAHRAMTDCDILARLFTRVHELGVDLQKLFDNAVKPKIIVQALVSYDDRKLADKAGFNWEGKADGWRKEMDSQELEEAAELPFKIRVISRN